LVEAIETEFVPVVIYNNIETGNDAKVLKEYCEPAWNNPVVRFIDELDGKDIISRKDGIYFSEIVPRMVEVLKLLRGGKVPNYILLLEKELNPKYQRATFCMGCYWQGEKNLGDVEGVISTEPGWCNSREVVEIRFNPEEISYKDLASKAHSFGFHVVAHDVQQKLEAKMIVTSPGRVLQITERDASKKLKPVPPQEWKYFLKKHPMMSLLPLLPIQATRLNSILGKCLDDGLDIMDSKWKDVEEQLSPKQIQLVWRISKGLSSINAKQLNSFIACEHDMKTLQTYYEKLVKLLDAMGS